MLNRWSVISVSGPEARVFLHSQLSHDIEGLKEGALRQAAFCTAKGRMLASFWVWAKQESLFLLCRAELVEGLVKRLNMFKLRRKCEIARIPVALSFSANSTGTPFTAAALDADGQSVELHFPGGFGLTVVSAESQQNNAAGAQTVENQDKAAQDDAFESALLQAGLPFVTGETVEMFVPQGINFDLTNGISFDKGCYPGQEIVARGHYLGKVKRRAVIATSSTAAKPGQDIWLIGKDNEPAGIVVNSVDKSGGSLLIAELPLNDILSPDARFALSAGASEAQVSIRKPPYNLEEKGSQF